MPTGVYERTPCGPDCTCRKHVPYERSAETRAKLSASKSGIASHVSDCACGWCIRWKSRYDGPCVECGGPIGKRSYRKRCLKCYNRLRYHENPERQRRVQIKNRYGITADEYCELLDTQDGACAICGHIAASTFELGVDHDHSCCPGKRSCGKCVRGLLCDRCNRGIGFFRDNPQTLQSAARYLGGD